LRVRSRFVDCGFDRRYSLRTATAWSLRATAEIHLPKSINILIRMKSLSALRLSTVRFDRSHLTRLLFYSISWPCFTPSPNAYHPSPHTPPQRHSPTLITSLIFQCHSVPPSALLVTSLLPSQASTSRDLPIHPHHPTRPNTTRP
jgi:hypothetical protein